MRRIDISQMTFVHYGKEWNDTVPPCKRECVPKLEQVRVFFPALRFACHD